MKVNPQEKPTPEVQTRQVLLSLFIIFHLAVILIYPNGGSYLGRQADAFLSPYANSLGLNTSWNFFSPDPAQPMYLHYHVRFDDEQGRELKEPIEGFIPPEKNQIAIDSSKRRFLYAMRFLLLDTNRMKMVFGPWLCRKNPGASNITMEHILEPIPALDKAKIHGLPEVEPRTLMNFSFRCNEASEDEVE